MFNFNLLRVIRFSLGFFIFIIPVLSYSEGYISPNNVVARAQAQVSYDSNTGLYTYQYSFTTDVNSLLPVTDIIIPLSGSSVINIDAPKGWSGSVWSNGSMVDFSATEAEPLAPGAVWDGTFPAPANPIRQGQTLSGFSFQSIDPPEIINFYVQGFTQLPEATEESGPDQLAPSPLDASESFKGQTKGPKYSDQLFLGGRRGAVDGFLAFRNIVNRDAKIAPVQIDIEFGVNGETVDQNTFKAYLNSQDVTADFKVTGTKTRRAVFSAGHLALQVGGRNTLLTTVQGIIPGSGRTAGDADRVVFTVQP